MQLRTNYPMQTPLFILCECPIPDHTFPNGIPNPLPKNHYETAKVVKETGADLGVAFDGDFDRSSFLMKTDPLSRRVYRRSFSKNIPAERNRSNNRHDPRVIWNTQSIVDAEGGIAIQSKTGHAFIKETMRTHNAIYGGEMSAHHYFRDFAFCDSGMIPCC